MLEGYLLFEYITSIILTVNIKLEISIVIYYITYTYTHVINFKTIFTKT